MHYTAVCTILSIVYRVMPKKNREKRGKPLFYSLLGLPVVVYWINRWAYCTICLHFLQGGIGLDTNCTKTALYVFAPVCHRRHMHAPHAGIARLGCHLHRLGIRTLGCHFISGTLAPAAAVCLHHCRHGHFHCGVAVRRQLSSAI